MCIIPGFPAALLDDPPQPQPPPAAEQQQQNQCSSEDEQSPKVRKPYTITKQREKWSDEEHDKFLEAVKLYGRAWRRIEEHVGTKTAVQIRSHAQKFFSKVVRESTTGSSGSGCGSGSSSSSSNSPAAAPPAIEIPPPRPKKRPSHPYPRKQGGAPKRRVAAAISVVPPSVGQGCIQQQDEENGSPKSVLSAAAELNKPAHPAPRGLSKGRYGACASSDSSITGPDGVSATTSDGSESFDAVMREEAQDPEQSRGLVSFQLFGQTVVVSNPRKPASYTEASSRLEETDKPPPSSSDLDNRGTMAMATDPRGSETPTPTTPEAVSCPCGVIPMLCSPPPPPPEQQQHQQSAPQPCPHHAAAAQPWWVFYGGAVTLPFLRLPVASSQQYNECSGTDGDSSSGASADSDTQQEAPRTAPKRTSVDWDAEQSAERSPRSAFSHQGRGFVPYKRQAAAQQPPSPRSCSADRQNAQNAGLSL